MFVQEVFSLRFTCCGLLLKVMFVQEVFSLRFTCCGLLLKVMFVQEVFRLRSTHVSCEVLVKWCLCKRCLD